MIVTALLLLAAPQAEPARPTVTVVAKPVADPDKKVCRREVPIGSMFAKKVCRSRNDQAQIDRDTDAALGRVRGPTGNLCGANGC